MEIPFIGGAYKGRSTNINAQVCQNLYPVMDKEGGKVAALMNTPGLDLFSAVGSVEVRGLCVMGPYVYAVLGNEVYRVDVNGTATLMTGNLLSYDNPVWMAENGSQIMITDETYGYILSGTTLTRITDVDFPTPSSLAYQDGLFIVSRGGTGEFYISSLLDGETWAALDYATAEAYSDRLEAVVSLNRELWLLGERSYEVWYNSGAADFPYERIPGAVNKVGLAAPHSAAQYQGTMVILDNERRVQMSQGYSFIKISTEQIEHQFQNYSFVRDAIAYAYSQEGHVFYVLTFPSVGKTWVWDAMTQLWHTRASDMADLRHRGNCHAYFAGKNIIGDYANGMLYSFNLSTYEDYNSLPIRRIRAAQAINAERKNIFHRSLEIEFESGVGLYTGQGSDPKAMLQWSDDGGHTWSNEHWAGIGAIGKYRTRAIWRRLGRSRDRVYRVTISDPVKTVLIGAQLEAEAGAH